MAIISLTLNNLNEEKRENITSKPLKGIFAKANTTAKQFVKEIKGDELNVYEVGQSVTADLFKAGEMVDVVGTSKGKGFSGSVKRHGNKIGPKGHGSGYHRGIGSMGSIDAARVKKGKKMAGRLGGETVTVQNLEVVKIDLEKNVVLIKGSVPGANNSFVIVSNGVKANTPSVNPAAFEKGE